MGNCKAAKGENDGEKKSTRKRRKKTSTKSPEGDRERKSSLIEKIIQEGGSARAGKRAVKKSGLRGRKPYRENEKGARGKKVLRKNPGGTHP